MKAVPESHHQAQSPQAKRVAAAEQGHHQVLHNRNKYITMFLREFIYFNKDSLGQDDYDNQPLEDKRYNSDDDKDVLKLSDTRKTRLSLKQINQMRKNHEAHVTEMAEESELIQAQYATPVQAPA
jgi:hypothetical protein